MSARAESPVSVRPASTVVLLRDAEEGVQTLLLRRNQALVFAGGYWVFPGGAVDAEDLQQAGHDEALAARIAAAREAREEAAVAVDPECMVPLSHWTTPPEERKRFATWFFAAPVNGDTQTVCIDGSEIHDACWMGAGAALAAHRAGELNLLPPTFITLLTLVAHQSVQAALDAARVLEPPQVTPVLARDGDTLLTLYPGDAGYESADAALPGARHRAALQNGHWAYYYQDVPLSFPPLVPQLSRP